jgi:hypothetical protein
MEHRSTHTDRSHIKHEGANEVTHAICYLCPNIAKVYSSWSSNSSDAQNATLGNGLHRAEYIKTCL